MHISKVLFAALSMMVITLAVPGSGSAQAVGNDLDMHAGRPLTAGWLERAVDNEVARLKVSVQQSAPQQKRNWIRRHPVLFGAVVGFGGGFLIGYLPGDDGVFDDFVAEFNGLVLGGAGALAGAIIGAVATD